MNRTQYGLLLVLAIFAGFVGGSTADWFFMGSPGYVHKGAEPQEEIQAQRFVVIDKNGHQRALLGVNGDEVAIQARRSLGDAIQQLPPDSPLAAQYRAVLDKIKTTENVSLIFYNADHHPIASLATHLETDPSTETGFLRHGSLDEMQREVLTPQHLTWNDVKFVEAPLLVFDLPAIGKLWVETTATGHSNVSMLNPGRGIVGMTIEDDGPKVVVAGEEGYQTWIGTIPLEARKAEKPDKQAAASIVIYDKSMKQLWNAP
jgi:hypothetical protein